jgi:hypothetical protein
VRCGYRSSHATLFVRLIVGFIISMNVAALQALIVIGFVIVVVSRDMLITEFRNGLIAEE